MKNEYRIVEYKDFFTVEVKVTEVKEIEKEFDDYVIKSVEECWLTVSKKGTIIEPYFIYNSHDDTYKFTSMDEAKELINDLNKYPIYHYQK